MLKYNVKKQTKIITKKIPFDSLPVFKAGVPVTIPLSELPKYLDFYSLKILRWDDDVNGILVKQASA
ncbi:MAG: hypothetical protein UT69_C0027G0002 [Candidatus Yanofskybacteria bacterium GW2011_GWE1_40_10]|nr:MAG: hypothetical protein UT69_C0027G0002 [Candidatus Yanofskybacteria bacterium GW2011_GWE1_40_10]